MSCGVSSRRRVFRVRRGATLVEQLLVVAIIGMVMALTFLALRPVLDLIPENVPYVVDEVRLRMASESGDRLRLEPPPPAKGPKNPDVVPDEYVVRFNDGVANPGAEANRLAAAFAGGRVLHVYSSRWFKGCSLHIPNITADALRSHASVQDVEPNLRRYICEQVPTGIDRIKDKNNEPFIDRQNNTARTRYRPDMLPDPFPFPSSRRGLPNVQGALIRSTGGIVAVADTGCWIHPDLNVTRREVFGFPDEEDGNGHGTHVAGTIGAKTNAFGVVGVVPGVEIWSLKVLGDTGGGTLATVLAGISFCSTNADKVDVLNMSLGGARSQIENDAVDACVRAGVIVVVAAGNEAVDAATRSPASAPLAVCVAALADSDGHTGGLGPPLGPGVFDDSFAPFSNFGFTVDVIAPGVEILSTWPGGQYASLQGTSMASPHVAGIMALYRKSVVITQYGSTPQSRPATGLEIVSLFMRNRGPDFIHRVTTATPPAIIESFPMIIIP